MPATLLGQDALSAMLAGRGGVTIANRCSLDETVRILAAVIVRHDGNGGVDAESAYELDLSVAESETLEPIDAAKAAPEAIEVLLRVFSQASDALTDVYLSAQTSGSATSIGWEAGLRDADGPLATGEVEVPKLPIAVAYLREV